MKILVADDHVLLRDGIIHTLNGVWPDLVVIEANNGAEIVKHIEANSDVDIVLMDLFMPDTDGFQVLGQLCSQWPEVPVVILSASENASHMRKTIDIGASGYVPKSLSKEIMISALKLVLSGGVYIPPPSLMESDSSQATPYIDGETGISANLPSLTGRQHDVLRLLAKGLTNKEVAKDLGLSEYTVKIHVTAIFKALNVTNRTQAVIEAKRFGIADS